MERRDRDMERGGIWRGERYGERAGDRKMERQEIWRRAIERK